MNTCGKITCPTRRAAERHLSGVKRAARHRKAASTASDGHAYFCAQCQAWHWSSITKREAQRRGLL